MKNLRILVENESDIERLTSVLGSSRVNIESLDIEMLAGQMLVVMTVDLYDLAMHVLNDASFAPISEDVIIINLPDKPGALAEIMHRLNESNIHVHSIRHLHRHDDRAVIGICADSPSIVRKILHEDSLTRLD